MREMPYKVALLQPASVAIDTNAAILAFAAASLLSFSLSPKAEQRISIDCDHRFATTIIYFVFLIKYL